MLPKPWLRKTGLDVFLWNKGCLKCWYSLMSKLGHTPRNCQDTKCPVFRRIHPNFALVWWYFVWKPDSQKAGFKTNPVLGHLLYIPGIRPSWEPEVLLARSPRGCSSTRYQSPLKKKRVKIIWQNFGFNFLRVEFFVLLPPKGESLLSTMPCMMRKGWLLGEHTRRWKMRIVMCKVGRCNNWVE